MKTLQSIKILITAMIFLVFVVGCSSTKVDDANRTVTTYSPSPTESAEVIITTSTPSATTSPESPVLTPAVLQDIGRSMYCMRQAEFGGLDT
ncbi:MAG: hypothetical protein WD469_14530 [Paenibacillaceae bacterium]